MPSDFFNELKKLLEKLPGIGPRQAARFIWALADFSEEERKKMAELINSLGDHLSRCSECLRIFVTPSNPPYPKVEGKNMSCSFCQPHSSRDHSKIMVVERDSDLINIEKSGIYKGLYHVLGGAVDPLEENQKAREGIKKLYKRITPSNPPYPKGDVKFEIILALSPNKLGEFTANYIIKVLEPISRYRDIRISRLARGLSTGTDLEYADETTLRQALDNRG